MALKNYEIVMVFSLANGEEAVEVLKQKFTDLIAKHGTLGNVEEWGKRKLHTQSTMKTMAIILLSISQVTKHSHRSLTVLSTLQTAYFVH